MTTKTRAVIVVVGITLAACRLQDNRDDGVGDEQ
jgi:hypothetical protein